MKILFLKCCKKCVDKEITINDYKEPHELCSLVFLFLSTKSSCSYEQFSTEYMSIMYRD